MNSFIWAVLTALTWGCVPLIEKMGLMKVEPLVGLFYRSLGVIVGITVLIIFKGPAIKNSFAHLQDGMAYLILGGFLASFVGQIFFYSALKSGEASKVVPISGAYPLVSFILGILFLSEKVTLAKISGVGLVLIGVVLLH